MSYDFRHRRAGQRDLISNFADLIREIDDKTRQAKSNAAIKVLKVAKDLLRNFDLTVDLRKSWIDSYKVGSDSTGYSGALVMLAGAGMTEEGINGAVWDATDIRVKTIRQDGEVWTCSFEAGG